MLAPLMFAAVLPAYYAASALYDRWTETVVLVTPNPVDTQHYPSVVDEMRRRRSPTLHAIQDGAGRWILLEGSHRLTAALELRRQIHIVAVGRDEVIDVDFFKADAEDVYRKRPSGPAWSVATDWKCPVEHVVPARRVRVRRSTGSPAAA